MIIARIANATRVLGQSQGYIGLPVKDEMTADPNCLDTLTNDTVNGPQTPSMVAA